MSAFVVAMVNGAVLSAMVTALVWLALRVAHRRAMNAATRYAVWWLVLAITVTLPLAWLPTRASAPQPDQGRLVRLVAAPEPAPMQNPVQPPAVSADHEYRSMTVRIPAGRWPNWIAAAWLLATTLMLIRLIASFIFLERRKARALDAPGHLVERVETWLARCGGSRRRVRLAISPEIATPIAAGPCKPTILIPARFLEDLDQTELDQIGLHEAAHLARRDDYALLLQRFVTALFVWHPAVRWISRRIDLEREIACDDMVVAATGRAKPYAACLTRVVELAAGVSGSPLAAAAADERSHLSARVEMLLDRTRRTGTRLLRGRLTAMTAGLVALACVAARAPALIAFAMPVGDTVKQVTAAPATSPLPVQMPAQAPIPVLAFAAPPRPQQPQATRHPTTLVKVQVTVTDPTGRFVTGLEKQHFRLFEDDIEQEIIDLVNDELPLSIAIVNDVRDLEESRQALTQFTSASNPTDEFFRVWTTFTTGTIPATEQPTSPLDGIRIAVNTLSGARHGRKAILIVTDNPVNFQSSPPIELRGIPIYAVVIGPANAGGPLGQLCEQTGGRYLTAADGGELASVTGRISVELRNQYLLRFSPSESANATGFRRLRVELAAPRGLPPLKVRFRSGYFR